MEGHQKFLRGGGVLKVKTLHLQAKYEAKLEFPRGTGVQNIRPSVGGEYGYFWNCTIIYQGFLHILKTSSVLYIL